MRTRLLLKLFILIAVIVAASGYFIYNKPHRNIIAEKAAFSLSLATMNQEFLDNEDAAFRKYFNQVVEISGKVVSINEKEGKRYDIVLNSHGNIANGEIINADLIPLKLIEQKVILKGLFIGYDNLLEEIKLSECSLKQLSTD